MSDALTVHLNREGLHSLSVPDSFTATGSFDVVLVNHGESIHVHLHLDDSLSEQAGVDAPNHHVEGGGERRVRVTRTGDGTARGHLKLVTAYGAETRLVDVELKAPDGVEVGEELTSPQPRTDDGELPTIGSVPLGPLLAASGAAVGLAVGAAAVTGSVVVAAAVVALGLLAVVGVVAVANRRDSNS